MIAAHGTSTKRQPCQLSANEIEKFVGLPEAKDESVGLPQTSNPFWMVLLEKLLLFDVSF